MSWSNLICNGLIELTKHDSKVAVITPAMINGSALNEYQRLYPNRLIDVGIAEEHAVTMAGGMATQGMKPFVSIYSTFFKRAFDQVHHDVARQELNVVFWSRSCRCGWSRWRKPIKEFMTFLCYVRFLI